MKQIPKILILSIGFIALDQLTKFLAARFLDSPQLIFGNFFKLQYAENTGIAFSLPVPYPLILLSNLILILMVVYLAVEELDLKNLLAKFSVALIVGGGIGNLMDRLLMGHVVDFISVGRYPYFNFADLYITVAVLLLVVFYGKIKRVKK